MKKTKKSKKENLFIRLINKILGLKDLKLFELALGWVRGMSIKIEFFPKKEE